MKTKTIQILTCALFAGFLGVLFLLYLVLPKESFSEKEKRYLSKPAPLSWSTLVSGEYGEQAESYAADHLPERDFFVGLNAAYDRLSGRQITKEIYVGKSGRLYEAPTKLNTMQIERNMSALRELAETADRDVDLMLVPSAGFVQEDDMPCLADPYRDGEIIDAAFSEGGEHLHPVDLRPIFLQEQDRSALYYGTDHHWTSYGAWLACKTYLQEKGKETLPVDAYEIRETDGFYGTTYARSGFWKTSPDSLALWDSGGDFAVENREQEESHEDLFYLEHLSDSDQYPVFLDGNHSLVRIRNLRGEGKGKLLVIRDSFANCMGCFLADAYEEVVLVDLRYYRESVSQLISEENFDDVLILYSVNNFMTDANIVRVE